MVRETKRNYFSEALNAILSLILNLLLNLYCSLFWPEHWSEKTRTSPLNKCEL